MERGGIIAWGIVPADGRIFAGESIGGLFDRYRDIRDKVIEYVSPCLFDSRSLITPSCGIHFSDERGADAIMDAAAAISCRIREGL
jgi:hypothetical protein